MLRLKCVEVNFVWAHDNNERYSVARKYSCLILSIGSVHPANRHRLLHIKLQNWARFANTFNRNLSAYRKHVVNFPIYFPNQLQSPYFKHGIRSDSENNNSKLHTYC